MATSIISNISDRTKPGWFPDQTIIGLYISRKIMKMNKVEILFKERAIIRGGTILFSKPDTLDFIQQCKNFEIGILGIDGFFITETITQPRMEDSVNYSGVLSNKNIYDSALEFVAKRDDHLFFEVVCESLQESVS